MKQFNEELRVQAFVGLSHWSLRATICLSIALCGLAIAQLPAAPDEEKQTVEHWVRQDVQRANEFLKSGPNIVIRRRSERRIPATAEQAAKRLERLAALKKLIDSRPDHPMRNEYDALLVLSPGGELLADGAVWLGTLNGRRVWRWSQTLYTDSRTHNVATDYANDGELRWDATHDISVRLEGESLAAGMRDGVSGTVGDVIFGWFGSFCPPFSPANVAVDGAGERWIVVLTDARGTNWKYLLRWDTSRSTGFVEERFLTMQGSRIKLNRSDEVSIGENLRAARSFILRCEDDNPTFSFISTALDVRASIVDDERISAAVRPPPVQSEGGDIVRGARAGISVKDLRYDETSPSIPWTQEARIALLSGQRKLPTNSPVVYGGGRQSTKYEDQIHFWLAGGAVLAVLVGVGVRIRRRQLKGSRV